MSASAPVVVIGACAARLDDGAGNGARLALLAEQENDVGEVALARGGDHVGRVRAGCAHAHVERTVEAEREAARRLIELHGGDAEIEHDAVDGVKAGRARNMIEIGEALLDQRQAAIRLRNEIGAARDRFRSRSMAMTLQLAAPSIARV